MIKYSLIIPLYNKEKYIKKTLNSIILQKRKDLEVIIIDDKSTDNSYELVKKIIKNNLENVTLLKNEVNIGVSETRNRGIELVKGEYCIFLDSDDCLKEKFFYKLDKVLDKYKISILCLLRIYNSSQKKEYDYSSVMDYLKLVDKNLFEMKCYRSILKRKIFFGGSAEIVIRTSLIKKNRFNKEINQMEDYDFYFNILKENKISIYLYNEPLVLIEDVVNDSLSNKNMKFEEIGEFKILNNQFLIEEKWLRKKIFWTLMYSYLSRMEIKDRLALVIREKKKILRNLDINKYFIGSLFGIFGIDLNKIRKGVRK